MEKLKLCPFCGGDFNLFQNLRGLYYAKCKNCGAVGSLGYTALQAISAWNRRK